MSAFSVTIILLLMVYPLYMFAETLFDRLYFARVTLLDRSAKKAYFYNGEYAFDMNFVTIVRTDDLGNRYAWFNDRYKIGEIQIKSDNTAYCIGSYNWSYDKPESFMND